MRISVVELLFVCSGSVLVLWLLRPPARWLKILSPDPFNRPSLVTLEGRPVKSRTDKLRVSVMTDQVLAIVMIPTFLLAYVAKWGLSPLGWCFSVVLILNAAWLRRRARSVPGEPY